jgi:hypothetical protein
MKTMKNITAEIKSKLEEIEDTRTRLAQQTKELRKLKAQESAAHVREGKELSAMHASVELPTSLRRKYTAYIQAVLKAQEVKGALFATTGYKAKELEGAFFATTGDKDKLKTKLKGLNETVKVKLRIVLDIIRTEHKKQIGKQLTLEDATNIMRATYQTSKIGNLVDQAWKKGAKVAAKFLNRA